jgi:hypothetical protein
MMVLACKIASAGEFRVFDATLYSHKPDLKAYGIEPLRVVYSQEMWMPGTNWTSLPSEDKVKRLATSIASESSIVALDVEHWPVIPAQGNVERGLSNLLTLFRWYKANSSNVRIGYYSFPPAFDYWRAIKPKDHPEPMAWQAENTALLPLAQVVDVLFPSLYTFYPDREGWVRFAKANIAEARRIGGGKPVYVFLWPQYHDSNRLLGLKYIDREYWQLELKTAKEYADGIVIWGGYDLKQNKPQQWDENAPWWVETKAFLLQQ